MKNKKSEFFNRINGMILIMVILFIILTIQLFKLQVVQVGDYREAANVSSFREISVMAPRGNIYDKNGKVLAASKQSYNLTFTKPDQANKEFYTTFAKVFEKLDEPTVLNSNGEMIPEGVDDDFEIKIRNDGENLVYYFDFDTENEDTFAYSELRFKKDRGTYNVFLSELEKDKKIRSGKSYSDYTDEEWVVIEEKLNNQTPEEIFDILIVKYEMYNMLNLNDEDKKKIKEKTPSEIKKILLESHSVEEIRKYMIILDKLYLQSFQSFRPIVVSSNISYENQIIFEQLKGDMPGIEVTTNPIRYYPMGKTGSSFLGYISKISSSPTKYEERGYDVNTDLIGKAGLESSFENMLKGSKGNVTIKVDNQGRKVDELFKLEASPGNNLILSIDSDLQKVTEKALEENMQMIQNGAIDASKASKSAQVGAAVVVEVNTGRILALASVPGYDPNIFSVPDYKQPNEIESLLRPDYVAFAEDYIKRTKIKKTVDDLFPLDKSIENNTTIRQDRYDLYPKAMYNYATQALLPPGSIFKIVTTIAGLEEGAINSSTLIKDDGIFNKYEKAYEGSCWIHKPPNNGSHGKINVETALQVSCNYFFYEVSEKLFEKYAGSASLENMTPEQKEVGLNSLAKYAWKFGLGVDPQNGKKGVAAKTGIEIFENFGQTYNTYTRKQLAYGTASTNTAVMLENGYYASKGKRIEFTPVDYYVGDNDSIELSNAKTAIQLELENAIDSNEDVSIIYERLIKNLPSMYQKLIDSLPEEEKAKYTKDDAKNMGDSTATLLSFDIKTQVTTRGNLYDASIGQGINNFTPLQMANMMATVINGGNRYELHLVDKITDSNNQTIEEFAPKIVESSPISQPTMKSLKEGMAKVVEEGGTAFSYPAFNKFNSMIKTGGKTGSASFGSKEAQAEIGRTEYGTFVSFAPYENPEIAVCVAIFNAGSGGYASHTLTAIYENYFKDKIKAEFPTYVPVVEYSMNPDILN